MKNTVKNKAKFFAQYYGQYVGINLEVENRLFPLIDGRINCNDILKLKPLSSITDEELIIIGKILNQEITEENIIRSGLVHKPPYIDVSKRVNNIKTTIIQFALKGSTFTIGYNNNSMKYIEVCDYLRSKRYAMAYMGLSVETLVEYGWIKTF